MKNSSLRVLQRWNWRQNATKPTEGRAADLEAYNTNSEMFGEVAWHVISLLNSFKGTWREIHRQCATAQGHEMPWTKSKLDEVWPVFRWFDYVPFRLVSGRPRRWNSSQKLGELNPPSSDPLGSGTAGAACKAKHSVKRRTSAMFRLMNGCRTEWFVYLNVCWILDIHGLIG